MHFVYLSIGCYFDWKMNSETNGAEAMMYNVSLNSDSGGEGENNASIEQIEISSNFVSLASQGL